MDNDCGMSSLGFCALSELLRYCVPVPRASPWTAMPLPLRGEKWSHTSNRGRTSNAHVAEIVRAVKIDRKRFV